jgi:hypothetical protein
MLSYAQTVPCTIAHRRAVGEVFVTDSARIGDDEFALAVQVPRAHSLWYDREAGYHDPLAMAEAARQGSFVVVHRHLGVPLDLPFSMQRYEFAVDSLEAFRDNEKSPLEGELRYRLSDRIERDGELGSMRIDGSLVIGGTRAMTVSGDVVFMSREDYTALRRFRRARKPLGTAAGVVVKPVDAALVGRRDPRNVVLGEGNLLVIDRRHPSFFDHDYDHVPGPLMVEGFRQIAIVAAGEAGVLPSPAAAMVRCRVTFDDFAEFEAPVELSAEVVGDVVRVGVHQFGKQLVEGEVELRPFA